jgi:hypothetical protein
MISCGVNLSFLQLLTLTYRIVTKGTIEQGGESSFDENLLYLVCLAVGDCFVHSRQTPTSAWGYQAQHFLEDSDTIRDSEAAVSHG